MTTLDETIIGGQAGHLTDHDALAARYNLEGRVGAWVQRTGSAQSIPNNTATNIAAFDVDTYDPYGFHTGSAGNLVIPAGFGDSWFMAMFQAEFAANATGSRTALIYNGALIRGISKIPAVSGETTIVQCVALFFAADGDTVQPQVKQLSGGALSLANTQAELSIVRLN